MRNRAPANKSIQAMASLAVIVALSLTVSCASVSTRTAVEPAPPAEGSEQPVVDVLPLDGSLPLITGSCRATVAPDRAVIVGGMSASGIKPTDVADRLRRQIDALKAVADEERGVLRLLERVRAARPETRGRHAEPGPDPYVALQRLELELPADADIDRVLERTLLTGLNRYGNSAGIEPDPARPQPLVVFRFDDLHAALEAAHDECRAATLRAWCEARGNASGCRASIDDAGGARTESFTLSSSPVTLADGSVTRLQLSWPFADAAAVELGGDGVLELSGAIWLRIGSGRR